MLEDIHSHVKLGIEKSSYEILSLSSTLFGMHDTPSITEHIWNGPDQGHSLEAKCQQCPSFPTSLNHPAYYFLLQEIVLGIEQPDW